MFAIDFSSLDDSKKDKWQENKFNKGLLANKGQTDISASASVVLLLAGDG